MSNVIHLAKPRNPPPPPSRVRPLKPNPDRERVIAEMLSRYHQLDTPDTGNPGDTGHDRILTRQHDPRCAWVNSHGTTATAGSACTCWVAAIDELTRCLETMRKLRKQRAIAYLDRNDVLRTDDIGVIYQHIRWWYIDCDYRPAPIIRKNGKGKFVTTGELKLVPVRHRDARQEKAEAGVRFLAHLFRGSPRLPGDVVPLLRPTA